jgi:V-type H+-transporting ATPase subunit d
MLFFNLDHGYLEAILRGFKSGLISRSQYTNFTQCESLEGMIIKYRRVKKFILTVDMRLQLASATDYGEYVQEQTGSGPLKPSLIGEQVRAKFVQDFRYLRSNATGDLATFLDYITYTIQIGLCA